MAKRILDGMLVGAGIVIVVGVAFAIAWAGDVFTIDKDGAVKFAVSDQGKITVGATESYVNLVIQNAAAPDNVKKVIITADVLTVEGIRLENVNVSADVTLSGAGGLDTGSETIPPANGTTWNYLWVIANNDGTLKNGLLSLSSTTPTMPSGYTRKRRVGAVANRYVSPGVADFLQFVQEGGELRYLTYQLILSGGTSATRAVVSASPVIPPTSRRGEFLVQSYVTSDSVGANGSTYVGMAGTSNTQAVVSLAIITAGALHNSSKDVVCETDSNQRIEYFIGSVPTSGGSYIYVLGYHDRI